MKKLAKSVLSLFLAVILLLAPAVSFAAGELGAEDNPFLISVSGADARPTKVSVPAGSSAWIKAQGGSAYFFVGHATHANYTVEHKGTTYTPDLSTPENQLYINGIKARDTFLVTNTDTENSLVLNTFLFKGSYENLTGTINKPEEVTLTPNIYGAIGATVTKELALGNQGYHFVTTAADDGVISVSIEAFDNLEDHNAIGWSYYVINNTKGVSSNIHYSDAEEPVYHEELEVSEGDEIIVLVSTYDPAKPTSNPEGVVSVQFLFSPIGSMNVPEEITLSSNIYGAIEATATANLEAGNQGYHFMTKATGDGKLSALIKAFDNETDLNAIGWSYSISNVTQGIYGDIHRSDEEEPVFYEEWDVKEGDEFVVMVSTYDPESSVNPEGVVSVEFKFFPIGSSNHPEKVEEGDTVTSLEANNEGYYYSWTATEDCTATVGIDTEATSRWQYSVNVMRADGNNSYGDTHWSDDEEVISSETHELKAGDTLRIWIATYNGTFRNPKGSVSWYINAEKINNVVYGDADGNGRITISDVLLIRKYLAGIDTAIDEAAADVDGNGRIVLADVLLVRKYLAGIITSFPIEE